MVEAEDDPQWKYWYQFMKKKAVLPKSLCSKYATQFTDNDVKVDQLTEVVEDVLVFLRHVGVNKAGHAMRIRTEARKLECNTAQVEEVQLVKIDEEDETREGGAESTLEEDGRMGEDGGSTTVVGEGEEEPREVSGGSSMAEEDSPSTVLVSQTCYHGPSETCVNCFICNKHLNTKSLPKHILNQHQLLTVPVTKRTSTSSTLPPVPVEGPRGQSFSAPQPSNDEENYEENNVENYEENNEAAIDIVPPLAGCGEPRPSVTSSSRKHHSGTVQGMVKGTGKQGWELLRVNVNKKPVKKLKVVSGGEPILISLKKAVQKVQSGRQPFIDKKPFRTVRKLKHPQWVVVEPRTNSTQQASQAQKIKSAQANSSLQMADFVTGISRFGRERKKKIQSY